MRTLMGEPQVLIAGGGIGGLATALTLHQIGVPCMVFESVREMKPLGVGINLQPNAVRELYDLGLTEAELNEAGVPAKEWARVAGYRRLPDGGVSVHVAYADGARADLPASLLIGADGIHSAVRAQMHPD